MDFSVRSLHRKPEKAGGELPLPCGWNDSADGGREGASHCQPLGGEPVPCSRYSGPGTFTFSPGIPEVTHWQGAAQGLSRRRVPGHLSHKKGTRRRVKVVVKV